LILSLDAVSFLWLRAFLFFGGRMDLYRLRRTLLETAASSFSASEDLLVLFSSGSSWLVM
jgi:hypothetical protein